MRYRWLPALALAGCVSSNGGERAPAGLSNKASTATPVLTGMAATIADPLGFLPADSEVIIYADLDRVHGSAVFRALEPRVRESMRDAESVMPAGCGIDTTTPGRTIRLGLKGIGTHQPHSVMVLTGVDAKHLVQCVGGIQGVTMDGGYAIYPGPNGKSSAIVLVDPTTIVAMLGADAGRDRLAAIVHSGAPLRGVGTFTDALSAIDTHAGAWFLIDGHATMFDAFKGLGFAFQTVVGGLRTVDGFTAHMRIRVDTPANATALSSILTTQFAPMKTMVERFDVDVQASDVVVDLGMSDDQVDTVLGAGRYTPPTAP